MYLIFKRINVKKSWIWIRLVDMYGLDSYVLIFIYLLDLGIFLDIFVVVLLKNKVISLIMFNYVIAIWKKKCIFWYIIFFVVMFWFLLKCMYII